MIYEWPDAVIIAAIGLAEVALVAAVTYPFWR